MSVVEREVKLTAPPSIALPPLSDPLSGVVAEAASTRQLVATYYDTDDLRLARAGASLRHRDDEGWAVKLPASKANGRLDRATYAFTGPESDPPGDALDLVLALTRAAPVRAVARLRTTRRAVRLRTVEGTPIGEVLDDDVTVVDGDAPVRAFRELEFEFSDGAPPAQAEAIVARLRAAGAGPPDSTPKIVRALGPRAAEPPDVDRAPEGAATIGEVVRAALAGPASRLVAHDPGVRRDEDPEDVHQARVATRRLRAHLRTFEPLFEPGWAEPLRTELGWLAGCLGAVRDADVLLERLQGRVAGLPDADRGAAERLLDRLRTQRGQAREVLLAAMRTSRYAALLDALVAAAAHPPLLEGLADSDPEMLRGVARRAWRKVRSAVRDLDDEPADAELHRVRKRAKRARYAAEAVEPAFGKPARRLAHALTDVQDVLGEHQDAVVAADWLRDAAGRGYDDRAAFVAGELVATERAAARAAAAAWPDRWRAASRPKLRRWL